MKNDIVAAVLILQMLCACGAAAREAKINYDESKIPAYELPDALVMNDGRRVDGAEMWMKERRPEILELFREHVYGRAPGRPAHTAYETVLVDPTLYGGLATRKTVKACFTERADGPCMNIHIFIPNGAPRPVPVFVGIMIVKEFEKTQDYPMPGYLLSEQMSGMWKYAEGGGEDVTVKPVGPLPGRKLPGVILKRGYAFATIEPQDLAPDDPESYDSQVIREYSGPDRLKRPPDDWMTIGAWAWGLSRAMDYFETDKEIDAKRVIALGHSRRGKTALWAAAQDERFAMAVSNNSGCTGAALGKRIYGETAKAINDAFPHWFCANYKKYDDNEAALPLDQHMLLALIAPRPLYVASASDDRWADPEGEFLSAFHAGPVYELFGKTGLGVSEMPAINEPVGQTIGYHIRSGGHAMTDYDWLRYLDFADRELGKNFSR